jgi:hypothetical protein
MWWVVNAKPRPLYSRERDPVLLAKGAGWASGSIWTGTENLAPTGIRSPDRPTCSESLYRLSYPGLSEVRTVVQVVRLQKHLHCCATCEVTKTTALLCKLWGYKNNCTVVQDVRLQKQLHCCASCEVTKTTVVLCKLWGYKNNCTVVQVVRLQNNCAVLKVARLQKQLSRCASCEVTKQLNLDHHCCEKLKSRITYNIFMGKDERNVVVVTRTHCEKHRRNVTNKSGEESIWVLGVKSRTVKLERAGRFVLTGP